MPQLWTITRLSDAAVLAACFPTPSTGSHPKDNGWGWDAAAQKATRIDAPPDVATQSWSGTAWSDDLGALRGRRWTAVKARRDQAQDGGCATPLGRVDTDEASRGKISGAVQLAMIAQAAGQPFTIAWTMQDNSAVTHDAAAMITMGVAVGTHVATCHGVALAKRAAIDAAEDRAAIDAVPLEGGWPS